MRPRRALSAVKQNFPLVLEYFVKNKIYQDNSSRNKIQLDVTGFKRVFHRIREKGEEPSSRPR